MAGVSGARRFSESDKATALVHLAANDGNIKRTARELTVNPSTLRKWRDATRRGEELATPEVMEAAAGNFADRATSIRDLALGQIEQAIRRGEIKPDKLITIVGVLDDKITRVIGLPTQRVEHTGNAFPSREEMAAAMGAAIQGVIAQATTRQEVIEAELVAEIPAATPTKLTAVG